MGISGKQIRDETIQSIDMASGSVKMGEVSSEVISSQAAIDSVDTTNDMLLIYDANNNALKKVAPTNLGVGGSGSPGGSDTQVQYNNGGSFGGAAQLIYDDSNHRLGVGSTDAPDVTLDVSGDVNFDGAAVFNESSADKDFRVESNNNTHMFFVDGGANRIGIGNNSPQTVLDITDPLDGTGAEVDAIIRLRSKKDVGIKLISDTDNSGESDNPFIDFYQDGSTDSTGRSNRLGTIAMEGDAATTFTGSIGNAFFMDAFHPNTGHSSRPLQLANASTNGGHSARITLEGTNGYVGMHTATPTSPVHAYGDVSGTPVMLVDNDNSSAGHGLKVTSDGTGTGTNLLDVESASTTHFRVRGDGRVGIGKVTSLPAAMLTVSSSNTDSDIAIAHKIHHIGDSDTYIEFGEDEVNIQAGGVDFIKITEDSSQDTITVNEGGADVDFRVESSANTHTLFAQGSSGFVGIGTSSPDGLLHIDGGTSNTELIIEKDANTTASIVFDVAGTRRFEISHDANEYLNFNSYSPNQDIFFNHTSDNGGTVRMLHIDGNDDGAVVVGNSVSADPYSGASLIVTGTMGHGLGTAFFVTQSASVVPGLHLHNARSTADTGIALRFSNHSVNAAATAGYYGQISLENSAASPSHQNPDIVFKVQNTNTYGASNLVEAMRIKNGGKIGIGTTSPDSILHIDNGTSNTEVIIEKDAGTSGSIVFHNAGSREADIAFSTNEDIEITNWVADKDITLNIVSGSTEAAALTVDASTGALIANKQFARGVASLNLGSGTTSTLDPSVEGAGTILVTASSITTPNAEPNENIHICTIPNGKTAGQILTVCIITDCLDGSTGPDTMGMLIFAMSTPIPSSRAITVVGSALGGTPQGASFTLLWTGSGWMVLSTFGGPA